MTARRRLGPIAVGAILLGACLVACQAEPTADSRSENLSEGEFLGCGAGYDNTSTFWYKLGEHGVWCQSSALDGEAAETVIARYPGLVVPKKSSNWWLTRKPIVHKLAKVVAVTSHLSLERSGTIAQWEQPEIDAFARGVVSLTGATSQLSQYKIIDGELFLRRDETGRKHGIMHLPDAVWTEEIFESAVGWDLLHNLDFGIDIYRHAWDRAKLAKDNGEVDCLGAPEEPTDWALIARAAFAMYDAGSDEALCRFVSEGDLDQSYADWFYWDIDDKELVVTYPDALTGVEDIDFTGILGITSALHGFGCGDGKVVAPEGCDDGNNDPGDGCGPTCLVEQGFACQYEPSICTTPCGDGVVAAAEDCDDGNTVGGDGCSPTCTFEAGYDCMGEPSVCASVCGDGFLAEGSEGCDDGNNDPGDGCSMTCEVEVGYSCDGSPSSCSSSCGDGVVAASEGCDDGNTIGGDGCNAGCGIEPGYQCSGSPSSCSVVCGDGVVAAGAEGCDDGNTIGSDGCDASCQPETGYDCLGSPSSCSATCGDGLQAFGAEECDDGNIVNGDGCSSTCQLEAPSDPQGEGAGEQDPSGPTEPPGADPGPVPGGGDNAEKPTGYDPEGENPEYGDGDDWSADERAQGCAYAGRPGGDGSWAALFTLVGLGLGRRRRRSRPRSRA